MNNEFRNKYYTVNLQLGRTVQSLTIVSDRLKALLANDRYSAVPQLMQFAAVLKDQLDSLTAYRQSLTRSIGDGDWKSDSNNYSELMKSMDGIFKSSKAIEANIPPIEEMVRTLEMGASLSEQGVI